ncbi:hypothetical protein ACN27F_18340 [Solwaraspora sp. WMMB335]|uniref:hypothetical protein n=1 Tax=Solwaraspora sp. WMMB335 TaxID=3404118 RepID=UPI003B92D689
MLLREALAELRDLGDRGQEGNALFFLSRAEREMGDVLPRCNPTWIIWCVRPDLGHVVRTTIGAAFPLVAAVPPVERPD